jgi:ABC-2 type transport system permease protein
VSSLVYARYELTRTFRNRRLIIFSFGFPLALYFLIAVPNKDETDLGGTGISAPVYFMIGLAAFGAMNSVPAIGGRIAAERSLGWNRQLRLTPLPTRAYFRVKLATAYTTAVITIVLLFIAGLSLGVHLRAADWAGMTVLMLIGLIPFAGLGIMLGHLVSADSIGPAIGGTTALLGLLGGVWFPITGGVLHSIAMALPSYWLVQASQVGLGGSAWGATGWAIVAAWSIAAGVAASRAYRRDRQRVPA